jgi:hypothetical protein
VEVIRTTGKVAMAERLKNQAAEMARAAEFMLEAANELTGADVLLEEKGIAHVLIGGLAVNAYGYHYSTHDVDFLVRKDDVFDGEAIITHKPGVPHAVGGVAVDYLTIRDDYPEAVKAAMEDALCQADDSMYASVVSDGLLVWMKLNAGRTKDLAGCGGTSFGRPH